MKEETTAKFITSSSAIQLAQFSLSQSVAASGSPSMVLVPSVEQYNTKYDFVTSGDYQNFMMISIPTGMQNQLFLDGNLLKPPTGTTWPAIPNSSPSLVGTSVELVGDAGGAHVLQHQDGKTTFGLWIFSRQKNAGECTMAFNAGSCINNQVNVSWLQISEWSKFDLNSSFPINLCVHARICETLSNL